MTDATETDLTDLLPACTVSYGMVLAGAGAARRGWGATTASGMTEYLGRNKDAARERARELGPLFGA